MFCGIGRAGNRALGRTGGRVDALVGRRAGGRAVGRTDGRAGALAGGIARRWVRYQKGRRECEALESTI